MKGKLFLVGTPIGNLGDISPRAIETLENCDFIAAEDTRVTLKLLNHFEIKKPMISYFEHNKREKGEIIVNRILTGETCALVTDAGMPAVSDPGEELVALCHEMGVEVNVIPGPSAFVAAIAVSGMNVGRFTFEGFLSMNKASRKEHLLSLVQETRTMLFYEAPHKLSATLSDLYEYFGDRELTIVREITKIHEEVIKTTLKDASQKYGEEKLRGEIVLVIQGAPVQEKEQISLQTAVQMAQEIVLEVGASMAAKTIAKQTGLKKGDIYKALQEENNA